MTRSNLFKIPLVNVLKLRNEEWFVLNQIIITWREICDWITKAEEIVDHGISNLMINEGENGVFGAVFGEVMKKNGLKVFNTMNGIKAGMAQEAFVNFHKWFIWDEMMRSLLIDKCNLPEDLFIISGHLAEDIVSKYQFRNSLSFTKEETIGKKVISLISVLGKIEEETETIVYLYNLANKDPNILLIVRFHPSEINENKIFPDHNLNGNIHFIQDAEARKKDTLYDQLSISDCCIVFGSTVALESKWFDVPCISYEKREESWVYLADNKSVFHCRDFESVKSLIHDILSTEVEYSKENKSHPLVADKIIEELNLEIDNTI